MSTGNLLHQPQCYTSVRTNAISAPFSKQKKGMGRDPSAKADSLGRVWAQHTPESCPPQLGRTQSPGWGLTTSPLRLGSMAALVQRGRVGGGSGAEEVPRGHCHANAVCVATLSSARRDPSLAGGRCGQTGGRELAFLLQSTAIFRGKLQTKPR